MRLLDTGSYEIAEFATDVPTYAILSHTWADEEVTLADIRNGQAAQLKGWQKITKSCQIALKHGFKYIWIDTCCIDKSSSAELSEAINSMFQWYGQASTCFAHLADVHAATAAINRRKDLQSSRWFARGWTLQELIAPTEVIFLDSAWNRIASRRELSSTIETITGISQVILGRGVDSNLRNLVELLVDIPVAQKFTWAAKRVTTRPEDVAYCLLGLFDINMPLLYGEGQHKAFRRLQEEIIRSTDDDSIFAWASSGHDNSSSGLLADGPAAFANLENDYIPTKRTYASRPSNMGTVLSNRGLTVNLSLMPFPVDKSGSLYIAFLDCDVRRSGTSTTTLSPAILVQKTSWHDEKEFIRVRPSILFLCMMNRILLPTLISDIIHTANPSQDDYHLTHNSIQQEIYVPHKPPGSRLPQGMIFYPEVEGSNDYSVRVISRSPTWQDYAASPLSGQRACYEINFDINPAPDVCSTNKAAVIGVVELIIQHNRTNDVLHTCIVAGLEAVKTNAMDIPATSPIPWASFETADLVSKGEVSDLLSGEKRETSKKLHQHLYISFDVERRYSRLFYRLRLDVDGGEPVKPGHRLGWT